MLGASGLDEVAVAWQHQTSGASFDHVTLTTAAP